MSTSAPSYLLATARILEETHWRRASYQVKYSQTDRWCQVLKAHYLTLHTEWMPSVYLLQTCTLGRMLLCQHGGLSPSFISFADVCEALNVTVSPGPTVRYSEGDNATLYCHISQKRKTDNLLAVRWVFAASPTQEHLMIKMTKFGSVQYYGNYTHNFHKQRLHLLKEKHGTMYKFLILSLQQTDQGHYICKVQEIGKHRNKWTAWSNGTAATEIRGERLLISILLFFLSHDALKYFLLSSSIRHLKLGYF